MPKGSLKIKPGQVKLVIGEPIQVNTFDIEKRYDLIEKVRNTIIKNYYDWQDPDNLSIKDMKRDAI